VVPVTWLEVAANGVVTVSILLAARNSVHTWWTGIVGCLLFAGLFFQAKLYADVTLQVFFVATSAWGWWQWTGGPHQPSRPITPAAPHTSSKSMLRGAVGALAYGGLLWRWTDAYAPFLDSLVLGFSIVAQLLLMKRQVQTWWFWLLVNLLAVPLFFSRELYVTAALYTVYLLNAVVALRHWHRLLARQDLDPLPART
jgi:nicotinamide mononucleotide transporter